MSAGDNVLNFHLPRKVFDSLQNQTVRLHLDLAARTWKPGTPWTVAASEKPFALPERGNCVLDPTDGTLSCHHAFRYTTLTRVAAPAHAGTCLEPKPVDATAQGAMPMDSGLIDPVATSNVRLTAGRGLPVEVCAGTPVTFTPYVEAGTGQLHLDVPSIQLDQYVTRLQVAPQDQQQR
jgi:hypothetical protein